MTQCAAGKPSLTARIKAEQMPAPAPSITAPRCGRNKIKELLKMLSMDIFLTSLTPLFGEEFRWSRDWLLHVPFPAFRSSFVGLHLHHAAEQQAPGNPAAGSASWGCLSSAPAPSLTRHLWASPSHWEKHRKLSALLHLLEPALCLPVRIFSPAVHKCNK